MAIDQATLLAKLEANAKRQKQVNDIARSLSATRNTQEPDVGRSSPIDLAQRPSPIADNQR